MSSITWTATELSHNKKKRSGLCWRVVEAQHVNATMKLVDTPDEQERLEALLDESKPPYPVECQNLHYLLFTPFRYKPYKNGSRFRRANQSEGVFYASENIETALAEKAFYCLLPFYADSPDTPFPDNPSAHTAFATRYKSSHAIDLTEPPFNKDERIWIDEQDYGPCQNFADEARKANTELIKSYSVRCPLKGKNISILSCNAFERSEPEKTQTWHLTIQQEYIIAICEFPQEKHVFRISDFSDVRLKNSAK